VQLEVVLDVPGLDPGVREEFVGFKDLFVPDHPRNAILWHLGLTEDFEHSDFGVQFNLLVLPKPLDRLLSGHLLRLLQTKLEPHVLDRLFELKVLLHVLGSAEVGNLRLVPDFGSEVDLLHEAHERTVLDIIVEDFHVSADLVVLLLHELTLVVVNQLTAAQSDVALLLLVVPGVGDDVLLHQRGQLEHEVVGQGAVVFDGRLAELFSFSEHPLLCFLGQLMVFLEFGFTAHHTSSAESSVLGYLFVVHQIVGVDTDFQVNRIKAILYEHFCVFLLIYSFNYLGEHRGRELYLESFDLLLRVYVQDHSMLEGLDVDRGFLELHPVRGHEFGAGCGDAVNFFDILHILVGL
jgi:hypothetical protein